MSNSVAYFIYQIHFVALTGLATTVSFHVTVMSLDTIDEGSMVRSFVPPFPKAPSSASKRMLIASKGGFLPFFLMPTSVQSLFK